MEENGNKTKKQTSNTKRQAQGWGMGLLTVLAVVVFGGIKAHNKGNNQG